MHNFPKRRRLTQIKPPIFYISFSTITSFASTYFSGQLLPKHTLLSCQNCDKSCRIKIKVIISSDTLLNTVHTIYLVTEMCVLVACNIHGPKDKDYVNKLSHYKLTLTFSKKWKMYESLGSIFFFQIFYISIKILQTNRPRFCKPTEQSISKTREYKVTKQRTNASHKNHR